MFDPQETLTISTLLELLRHRYTRLAIAGIRHIRSGINHSYLVTTTSDKFILRVYHPDWRSEDAIISEADILLHLADKNIPVSFPIADDLKSYVQTVKLNGSNIYCMLFSYAEGDKIKHQSVEQHERNGLCMANMHDNSPPHIPNRTDYRKCDFFIEASNRIKQHLVQDDLIAVISESTEVAKYYYKNSAITLLPQGFVHLDFWADNMHVTPDGARTIFDFDFCGQGYFVMDIAYYLLQLRAIEQDINRYSECRDAFLRGYEKVRRLQAEEHHAIRPFTLSLLLFYLGVQFERTDWSSSFLNDKYIQDFINERIRPVLEMIS